MLLVFVDVMKELPATLVLRPFNSDTLAVVAYQLARDERLGEAALPSLAIVAGRPAAGAAAVALAAARRGAPAEARRLRARLRSRSAVARSQAVKACTSGRCAAKRPDDQEVAARRREALAEQRHQPALAQVALHQRAHAQRHALALERGVDAAGRTG